MGDVDFERLGWVNVQQPATDEAIQEVEQQLNIKLPKTFVRCIKKYHGASPRRGWFEYIDDEQQLQAGGIAFLFGINLTGKLDDNIVEVNDQLRPAIPQGLVAFGQDPGDGYPL
jgi:hypothetical protein